jgi:hypothetical protein
MTDLTPKSASEEDRRWPIKIWSKKTFRDIWSDVRGFNYPVTSFYHLSSSVPSAFRSITSRLPERYIERSDDQWGRE